MVPQNYLPKLCRHKAKNRAFVRLGDRTLYLGRWGSAEAQQGYDHLIREFLASGREIPKGAVLTAATAEAYSVAELAADFLDHARTYYVKNGEVTDEVACLKSSIQSLIELYGDTPSDAFGPRALLEVRQRMVAKGWTRKYVNASIWRIKRMFGWGVTQERIKGETHYRLQTVVSLRKGRSGARDNPSVKPAPHHLVEAVLPLLSRQVRGMVELQLVTGARPGEIVIMRGCDIHDLNKPVWRYVPAHHKTENFGELRQIAIGAKGQAIIRPFLKPDAKAYLFSPADAEHERREKLHAARRTPSSCGNNIGTHRVDKPRKMAGDHYETHSYSRAIREACEKAFPVPGEFTSAQAKVWRLEHRWHVHQLRHSFASMIRAEFGLDPVQQLLGHKHAATSEIYAERNFKAAELIIAKFG